MTVLYVSPMCYGSNAAVDAVCHGLDNTLAAAGGNDVQGLIKVLFLPIAELTDDRGRHAYARFIMHFLSSFRYQAGTEHPGWKPESAASRQRIAGSD